MTLTLRADCPSCEGSFRVPLIAEITSGNRAALSFDPFELKKRFDEHIAQDPERHEVLSDHAETCEVQS